MSQRVVITFDGLAASGKSTLAKLLAERLGYIHLNTGLLYRSVAWLTINSGIDPHAELKVVDMIGGHHLQLALDSEGRCRAIVDSVDVTDRLLDSAVSQAVSFVSRYAGVREFLFLPQREAFPGSNLVVEGRDMGTVVFPDSPLKFFVVANVEIRVKRRVDQLFDKLSNKSQQARLKLEQETRQELLMRDQVDSSRSIGPMVPATDSITLDNSSVPLEQLVAQLVLLVKERNLPISS